MRGGASFERDPPSGRLAARRPIGSRRLPLRRLAQRRGPVVVAGAAARAAGLHRLSLQLGLGVRRACGLPLRTNCASHGDGAQREERDDDRGDEQQRAARPCGEPPDPAPAGCGRYGRDLDRRAPAGKAAVRTVRSGHPSSLGGPPAPPCANAKSEPTSTVRGRASFERDPPTGRLTARRPIGSRRVPLRRLAQRRGPVVVGGAAARAAGLHRLSLQLGLGVRRARRRGARSRISPSRPCRTSLGWTARRA